MSMSRLRKYLLAIPAVLTLAVLTVPSEHLQALAFGRAEANPTSVDLPCAAPPGMSNGAPVRRLSQR